MYKEFKVEKNVMIPAFGHRSSRSKYPFAEMEVKDSFFIPAETQKEQARVRANIYGAKKQYQLKTKSNFKVVSRVVHESRGPGLRVWRTE